ncbi:MAG: hypothetical protein K9H64_04475 [Bacteroidales bacterium]|nr:hypothetical protein [Bacteroidales bacterium]MCF8455141.1 hypothetical protein [Bacteroidales bacterium]
MASRYIGINLFQIPALTPNVNYTYDIKPFISPMIDLGFTPNYQSPLNMDYINFFLTPHCKCANEGYDIDKQTGGYIKIGSYFNFRKDYEKQKFFHFGLFLNNSIIHERGSYQLPPSEGPIEMPVSVEHTKYIFGLSISTGYEFRITQKMKMNFDFQASLPNKTYQDLFGYRNYIPGMGFKDDTGYWFPMLIWNLKYRI